MEDNRQDIEQLLEQGNNIQIKPQGYSMYPVLVPGRDEAVVEPVAERILKRGDVVLYRRVAENTGHILVLHRIWKIKPEGIYLVGDNQREIEGPLMRSQMKGIMAGIYRKDKYISVRNPWYRLFTGGWLLLRPIRPIVAGIAARIKGIFTKKEDKD
ncbi:MAG: S24/S26 family peptidase [Lachnospiraceae bacterium]|nr:S24/S26 family peptidase [Lachnospiraceae bacterium]